MGGVCYEEGGCGEGVGEEVEGLGEEGFWFWF